MHLCLEHPQLLTISIIGLGVFDPPEDGFRYRPAQWRVDGYQFPWEETVFPICSRVSNFP